MTLFVDHGVRSSRRYRPSGPWAAQARAWNGACLEARTSAGSEHVFADGAELIEQLDRRGALSGQARAQAADVRRLLPPDPIVPVVDVDPELAGLADRGRVTLLWAGYGQRIAVGDGQHLDQDERTMSSLEVADVGEPACCELIGWDGDDLGGSVRRVEEAVDAVRALAELEPSGVPSTGIPGGVDLVFGPGRAGPLFHELVGHPLEADLVASGSSYLAGRLGDQVAPDWLVVHDGPAEPGQGLQAGRDDEGVPAREAVLIDAGRVAGVLSDQSSGPPFLRVSGATGPGHGRRLDYRHPVLPRMWHTVARVVGVEPEQPTSATIEVRGLRLEWMNLWTGDFEFTITAGILRTDRGAPRRVGPVAFCGNGSTVLAALRPGEGAVGGGGRASKGCGKLGQFPLVTTFANAGVWIPSGAADVHGID